MPLSHVTLTVASLPTSTSFFLSALQPLGYRFVDYAGRNVGFGAQSGAPADFWLAEEQPKYVFFPLFSYVASVLTLSVLMFAMLTDRFCHLVAPPAPPTSPFPPQAPQLSTSSSPVPSPPVVKFTVLLPTVAPMGLTTALLSSTLTATQSKLSTVHPLAPPTPLFSNLPLSLPPVNPGEKA